MIFCICLQVSPVSTRALCTDKGNSGLMAATTTAPASTARPATTLVEPGTSRLHSHTRFSQKGGAGDRERVISV